MRASGRASEHGVASRGELPGLTEDVDSGADSEDDCDDGRDDPRGHVRVRSGEHAQVERWGWRRAGVRGQARTGYCSPLVATRCVDCENPSPRTLIVAAFGCSSTGRRSATRSAHARPSRARCARRTSLNSQLAPPVCRSRLPGRDGTRCDSSPPARRATLPAHRAAHTRAARHACQEDSASPHLLLPPEQT